MKTISNREFVANPEMYLCIAREQEVRVKKGRDVFSLIRETDDDEQTQHAIGRYLDAVYPDGMPPLLSDEEEIARAISFDELKERMSESIHKFFADKQ